jgi:Flp pilus assembly protein TadG
MVPKALVTDTCFRTNPPIGDAPGANMTTRKHDDRRAPRRGRGDDGASLVEFALISILLFTLLFGIISFGLMLSFRQDVTRAAAEGARGGAVAIPLVQGQTFKDAAEKAAESAVDDAVKSMGKKFTNLGCDTAGMTCAPPTVAPCVSQPTFQCVTVKVSYAYDDFPLYGEIPFMSAFFPEKIEATSVARINS